MNWVKAVVFDWAGTMVDFGSRAPVMAMTQAFDAAGVPVSAAIVRKYMGLAKRDHVVAILGEASVKHAWQQRHDGDATTDDVDALVAALEPLMAENGAACSTLIPGAVQTLAWLAARDIRVGSTTGYTRTMMAGIIPAAAAQGYAPAAIVCAGETAQGRPAPFMIWRALEHLCVWPTPNCVVVDDAAVGIQAGKAAGAWTVAVAASGNGIGLGEAEYLALDPAQREALLAPVVAEFQSIGADFVAGSVADLPAIIAAIDERIVRGQLPGSATPEILI